mmetsp:Transcript_73842/g.228240  ORF Transcript_73842/g.228240 Transcript_73842/m.228240 type:complete len:204 (+) Transcript_73842:101-712(+)
MTGEVTCSAEGVDKDRHVWDWSDGCATVQFWASVFSFTPPCQRPEPVLRPWCLQRQPGTLRLVPTWTAARASGGDWIPRPSLPRAWWGGSSPSASPAFPLRSPRLQPFVLRRRGTSRCTGCAWSWTGRGGSASSRAKASLARLPRWRCACAARSCPTSWRRPAGPGGAGRAARRVTAWSGWRCSPITTRGTPSAPPRRGVPTC